MGVEPKIRGKNPKRMVYIENPIKMDDLGVPLFLETPKFKFQLLKPTLPGSPKKRPYGCCDESPKRHQFSNRSETTTKNLRRIMSLQ